MIKNKKKFKKIYLSRALFILFSIVVLTLLFNSFSLFHKRTGIWKKVGQLESQKRQLAERKNKLELDLENLNKDAGVEDIVREKFNAVRLGEEVVILTEPKLIEQNTLPPKNFWSRIKHIFKNN